MIEKLVLILAFLCFTRSQITEPVDAIGTVLPQFNPSSVPYRVFNDLMKQSLPLVPYQLSSWGSIGRCWSCNLTFINGLSHNYPSTLPRFVWAVAQIKFLQGNDEYLANQTFNIKFAGSGVIGANQQGQFNLTWNQGTGGQFTLKLISQSLFIYIYNTDPLNPVNSISVTLASLGATPPLFTAKFLNSVNPFKILRTCFWQGQNLYNSGKTLQIWNNRTLVSSSTQISSNGVAMQHILQLEKIAGVILWPCIPDTADNNFIIQLANLIGSFRDKNKLMYLEYGNAYTTMNDFPDLKTNPAFTTFMQAYGSAYRTNVLFTVNYKNVQYYINAITMTNRKVNFTYIDAIGFDANFGILDIGEVWNGTIDDIKSNLTNQMLAYQVVVNKAYQISKQNKTNLVIYTGGPHIKTYRYAYIWKNTSNSSYAANATIERQLANTLYNMNLNDSWVGEFYLQWLARLRSMGVKSVLISQLVGGAFTTDTDIVPIVPFLNMTTPASRALTEYSSRRRATTLPTSGTLPPNPFRCVPSCVWGDCINNVCACYAGYSGSSCNVQIPMPDSQDKIGVNLQGVSYWTTQHPYVDMHKEGSDWVFFTINGGWSSGDAFKSQVKFDINGYPTYLPPGIAVGTLIARDVKTHYDPGNYTILYDGDGILSFGMYDVLKVTYGIGKCIIQVLPSTNMNNGILVRIDRTNPSNYIKNIRVIRPGFQNTWYTQKFSPMLLEKLSPYKTLRFMDWTNTNGQTDKNWTSRVYPAHRTFTKNGVPWEDVIHLANILGKDVWINIPHLATSDYIMQLSKLFLARLAPRLKVYVQYSNEVWGTLFPGGQYAQAQGVAYYRNNISDPTQARFCWLSLITNNISDIWRSVWNSTQNRARLNIVVSTQSVNADTTRRILACQNLYTKVNYVAIAPYISTTLRDNMTNTDVFNALNAELSVLNATMKTHLNITRGYNISLSCYEAGQGLTPSTAATNTLQVAVQTDPRMQTIYTKYFQMLFNNSMTLVNHYTDSSHFSKYGSWGMFQYTDQSPTSSAKWNGTKAYLTQRNLTILSLLFGSCSRNCSNNGLCSFNKCICYSQFTGDDCSIGRYVDFIQCGYLCTFNQGVCQLNETVGINRYFTCTCNPGYTGVHCGIPICSSNCSYAGKCVGANNCTCFRGRMGVNCEIDCGCGGHGTCNTDGTCQCDTGFVFNTTSKKCQYSCFGLLSSQCYGPQMKSCSDGCVGGTCNNGTCQCWPGYSGLDCSTQAPSNYINDNLGINIGGLSYWSTQHFLKDYFKQSSQWIPQYYPGLFNSTIAYTWNTNESFPTMQPNGYPGSLNFNQSAAKLLLRDLSLHYPYINETDDYVLLYDGTGVLELGFDARVYEQSNGRIRFRVVPSTVRDNGVIVKLLKTNPTNPIRNIRVVLSRDEYNFEKDLVSPNFMTFMNQFSTIRFMDLLHTNGNPVKQWNQTTRPDQDTQAKPSGISIQLLTKIVQRTGRNAWINIPHLASNNYIQTLAQYLKANISSNKLIYIEYSNQVWNAFFDQGKYAQQQATALGLANYHKFYAKRSLEIFNIFSSVFGTATSSRVKFVISYQAVSKWVADQILNGTGLVGVANIVAGGPYYDCDSIGNTTNTALYATLTAADIIAKCNNSFSTMDSILSIQNTVASAYNLSIAAYQSGTSISQTQPIYTGHDNPDATTNFIQANRDSNMYQIYKKLLNYYKNNNFTTNAPLMLFSSIGLPSKYGSWGLLDYLDQVNENPTHPKFQAVVDFNLGV